MNKTQEKLLVEALADRMDKEKGEVNFPRKKDAIYRLAKELGVTEALSLEMFKRSKPTQTLTDVQVDFGNGYEPLLNDQQGKE